MKDANKLDNNFSRQQVTICLLTLWSVLQTQTYALQDRLQKNMCASCLIISADHAEMKQVVGETQEITRLVATRYDDVNFARDLGTVLLDHLTQTTELDSMTLMGELCCLATWCIIILSALLLYVGAPAVSATAIMDYLMCL